MKKVNNRMKEDLADDYCFVCKDGGNLRLCDFRNCPKAYHPDCVCKDDMFLETDELWTCGLHSCFFCQRSSNFRCFCCPKSFCRGCKQVAEFVQVRKRRKGFCNNCLKLAIMIEENIDVDSDGEKVDFEDRETFEFLFKDFWDIIKVKEGLTLADLRAADAIVKREEKCTNRSDSRLPEEELLLESGDMKDTRDQGLKRKRCEMKAPIKRSTTGRKTFRDWGSEELISFLASIGKNTEDPLSQSEITNIIKIYIKDNKLFNPDKKKRKEVLCDERLVSLFRKKNLNLYDIYNLLETHLADITDSDDENLVSFEDGDDPNVNKKQQRLNFDQGDLIHTPSERVHLLNEIPTVYAAIEGEPDTNANSIRKHDGEFQGNDAVPNGIDAGYVDGSFIRPRCFGYISEEISGDISEETEQDKPEKADGNEEEFVESNERKTDQGDKMASEIEITNLEEIDTEQQKPTEDDVIGSKEELVGQSIGDQWDKMPSEKDLVDQNKGDEGDDKMASEKELFENDQSKTDRGDKMTSEIQIVNREESENKQDKPAKANRNEEEFVESNERKTDQGDKMASEMEITNLEEIDTEQHKPTEADMIGSKEELVGQSKGDKCDMMASEKDLVDQSKGDQGDDKMASDKELFENDQSKTDRGDKMTSEIQVVNREESETDQKNPEEPVVNSAIVSKEKIHDAWHYLDPLGREQGPFPLEALRDWKERGFFVDSFKVRKPGQTWDDAILLTDALTQQGNYP